MKKLLVLFLLVIFSCTSPHMWTRPHPDNPSMPYDTLAYRAWRGDTTAQRQIAERPKPEKRDYKKHPPLIAEILRSMIYVDWGSMIQEEERHEWRNMFLEDRLWRIEQRLDELYWNQYWNDFWNR